jgi:hypothetical protein
VSMKTTSEIPPTDEEIILMRAKNNEELLNL